MDGLVEMGRIKNKKVFEKRIFKLKRDVYMLRRENDNSFIKKNQLVSFHSKYISIFD